jgi:hypothetical protein
MTKFQILIVFVAISIILFCDVDDRSVPNNLPYDYCALVTTTDYSVGSLNAVYFKGDSIWVDKNILALSGDPWIVTHDDYIFLLERYGFDNLILMNKESFPIVKFQIQLGQGSNPYDVHAINDSIAYVSRFNSSNILKINLKTEQTNSFILDSIDISVLADEDNIPEVTNFLTFQNQTLAICQKLTNFQALTNGTIAVIKNDILVDSIPLQGRNPNSVSKINNNSFIVACPNDLFNLTDGWIELITKTDSSFSSSILVTESDLGGNPMMVVTLDDNTLAIVVMKQWPETVVLLFDYNRKSIVSTIPDVSAVSFITMLPKHRLLIADRDLNHPGIYIFDLQTSELSKPIDVGLPPNCIAILN